MDRKCGQATVEVVPTTLERLDPIFTEGLVFWEILGCLSLVEMKYRYFVGEAVMKNVKVAEKTLHVLVCSGNPRGDTDKESLTSPRCAVCVRCANAR